MNVRAARLGLVWGALRFACTFVWEVGGTIVGWVVGEFKPLIVVLARFVALQSLAATAAAAVVALAPAFLRAVQAGAMYHAGVWQWVYILD